MKTNIAIILSVIAIIISVMDYTNQGFNEFLTREQPVSLNSQLDPLQSFNLTNSLAGEHIDSEMDGVYAGPGINAANITTGYMKFDRARGGELILGGEDNVSGVLSLKDDLNNERLALNKDGLQINDGSITIKNANNQTIIDSLGLVSTNSFIADQNRNVSVRTTTSATYVDLPNTTLSFNLGRESKVLVTAHSTGSFDTMDQNYAISSLRWYANNGLYSPEFMRNSEYKLHSGDATFYTVSKLFSQSDTRIFTLPAGQNTLKLQFRITTAGTARLVIEETVIAYVILGK